MIARSVWANFEPDSAYAEVPPGPQIHTPAAWEHSTTLAKINHRRSVEKRAKRAEISQSWDMLNLAKEFGFS